MLVKTSIVDMSSDSAMIPVQSMIPTTDPVVGLIRRIFIVCQTFAHISPSTHSSSLSCPITEPCIDTAILRTMDDVAGLITVRMFEPLLRMRCVPSSIVRSIAVSMQGSVIGQLNELEWVDGEIWANVWQTMKILRINPTTGSVVGIIDCTGIIAESELISTMDVFNGIAYDSVTKAIYVTGKNWAKVYQIELQ